MRAVCWDELLSQRSAHLIGTRAELFDAGAASPQAAIPLQHQATANHRLANFQAFHIPPTADLATILAMLEPCVPHKTGATLAL